MRFTREATRRHLGSLLFLTLCAVCCLLAGSGRAQSAPDDAATFTEVPFSIPTSEKVLQLLAAPTTASPLATRPTLLLFTDGSVHDARAEALRATVRQLADDIPSSVLRVHTYDVPPSVRDRRLVDMLLNGVSARLPALVLFHGDVKKAQIVPGVFISSVPFFTPVSYPRLDRAGGVSYMELRTWVLSQMPARYIDPVTYHLIPSLQFVFHPAEATETLRVVRQAVSDHASRSVLPAVVSMAYVRLTTHGSEEVLAALSSLAAQAGNAALTLVTESREVAAAWGLTQEHTMATAPWASVEAAYRARGNPSASAQETVVMEPAASSVRPIGTLAEVVEAVTMTSSLWRAAAVQTHDAVAAQLRAWGRAVESFNATSPLRKIDTVAHLMHELVTLQHAIKVLFVLRESDDMWFHHHLNVAVKLAGRLQQTSVLYNTTTLAKFSKVPSQVLRSWSPGMRVEVFWMDAEQLPEVADHLSVAQVPSVLVLAPLQSRYQEAGGGGGEDGESKAEDTKAAEAGLRSRDPLIGVHAVNRYDLNTAAFINDATAAVDPPTGKDALPLFPPDSDAMVRFLASQSFLGAVQHALRPIRLSELRNALLSEDAESSGSGSGAAQAASSTLPNRRYAKLDHRYYPLRQEEEPMEGPVYVRNILNGATPLPVLTEEERRADEATTAARQTKGSTTTAAAKKDAKAAAAEAKRKAAWEAELAKRKRDRAARMERKAADDAAAREKEKAAFQQSVEAAFREEEAAAAAAATGANAGDAAGTPQINRGSVSSASRTAGSYANSMLVRRPPRDAADEQPQMSSSHAFPGNEDHEDAEDAAQRVRRRRRHAEYKEWQANRALMVEECVSLRGGRELSLRFKWD